MKCIYYLTSTLSSTHDVAEDLHQVGVKDFYLHVISKDECGLKKQHIHSSNYLETLDVPSYVYAILVGAATLFGAWSGGLAGIGTENKKLRRFHDDIDAGKYLILVYVRKHQEATVRKMMTERHSDAELVAVDSHFINPFTSVER